MKNAIGGRALTAISGLVSTVGLHCPSRNTDFFLSSENLFVNNILCLEKQVEITILAIDKTISESTYLNLQLLSLLAVFGEQE